MTSGKFYIPMHPLTKVKQIYLNWLTLRYYIIYIADIIPVNPKGSFWTDNYTYNTE